MKTLALTSSYQILLSKTLTAQAHFPGTCTQNSRIYFRKQNLLSYISSLIIISSKLNFRKLSNFLGPEQQGPELC